MDSRIKYEISVENNIFHITLVVNGNYRGKFTTNTHQQAVKFISESLAVYRPIEELDDASEPDEEWYADHIMPFSGSSESKT